MQGPHPEYLPPSVHDYGSLVDMTAALHPLFGTAVPHDLSFSAANAGPGVSAGGAGAMPAHTAAGSEPGGITGTPSHGVGGVVGAAPGGAGGGAAPGTGGGAAGGGASGGGNGGASGSLPFTGFAAGAAAALGGSLVAFGGALRNVVRRSRG